MTIQENPTDVNKKHGGTIYIPRLARKAKRVSFETSSSLALAVERQQARRMANLHATDGAGRWATHRHGEHRRKSTGRIASTLLFTACLLVSALLFSIAFTADARLDHALALVMSGALFNAFVYGVIGEVTSDRG